MKNILILMLVVCISACTHPVSVGPNATNLTVGKVQGEIKEGMAASAVAVILGSPNIVRLTFGRSSRKCKASAKDTSGPTPAGSPELITKLTAAFCCIV